MVNALKYQRMKPTEADYYDLFAAAFGKGDAGAQFTIALIAWCASLEGTGNEYVPKLKELINNLLWDAYAKGKFSLLRELLRAAEELHRSPAGRDRIRCAMLADKIKGGPPRTTAEWERACKAAGINVSTRHLHRLLQQVGTKKPGKRGRPRKKAVRRRKK